MTKTESKSTKSKSKATKKPAPVPILATLKALYGTFRPAILAQGALIAVALVLVLGAVGFRLAEPWPLKFIFDGLMDPQANTGFSWLDHMPWSTELSVLIGLFIAIVFIHTGATFLSKMAMAVAFRRLLSRVRNQIFDHLLHMSVLSHHHYGKGDLANRVTVDIDRLRLAGTNNAINLIVNVLTMVGMLCVMFWVNWQLAIIAALAMPLFQLLTRHLMPQITANSRAFRASDGALASETVHATSAIETIQGMLLFDRAQSALERGSEENLSLGMHSTILKTVLRQAVIVLFALTIGLLVWRGAHLVGAGLITPGDLIIFMSYLREGMEKPMVRFSANLAEIARGAASGERLLALLKEKRCPDGGPGTLPAAKQREIRFDNVSFSYPDGPLILDKVSFTISPGERVAIVGASGSGKSTLIALLLRLYEPNSGKITLDGIDITLLSRQALASALTPVFQHSAIFGGTVEENVTLVHEACNKTELDRAMQAANASEFVNELDGQLDHHLSPNGSSLSGGQAQRIGIARAHYQSPNVLLLDEPTSALDPDSSEIVMNAILDHNQRASVLMITHDYAGLKGFESVYRLKDGQLHNISFPVHLITRSNQKSSTATDTTNTTNTKLTGKQIA